MHRPSLTPGNTPGTKFIRGCVDPRATVRWEGFYVNENPPTPAGIEPAIFRFVAQHLNQCATVVPRWIKGDVIDMYIALNATYRYFCHILVKLEFFSTDFRLIFKYRISLKSIQWEPRCSTRMDGKTDRQKDMIELVPFRRFARVPKSA
jgi:hypothetical protein